ncbi:MAG: hypothetical protein NT046_13385 [Arenimonas sp.]|nr:hypothetical protein [Arenimonas sp.]
MDFDQTPQEDANTIPKRTTPTWDMELLLSGATVFALFQGAQAMMASGAYLLPRLQGDLLMLCSMLFTYGYGGLILLSLTFALHLVIRAYWVALIGMNSVFPQGIKVDALKAGPLTKAVLVQRVRSMQESIERADNGATIVFGIGVSIVLVLVPVSLTVTVMFGLAALMARLLGVPAHTDWIMMGLMALLFLPYLASATVDTRFGHRLRPGSLAHRMTHACLVFYARIGLSRASNPLVTVFSSNIGERRGQAIIFTVMLVAMLSSLAGLVLSRKDLGLGSFAEFPDPLRGMSSSVEGRSYANSQEPDWSPATPYLPDLVVRGDYARLVVPYTPNFSGHLMKACPSSSASDIAGEERARREALLDCFSGQITVSLDCKPLAVRPDWYTEPARDVRGLLYMVPMQGLAKGRHELSVLTRPEEAPKAGDDPEQPFVIAFWR